ncbi:MAG: hypothetical protein AAFP88_03270 [Bacteroidota bacterium]
MGLPLDRLFLQLKHTLHHEKNKPIEIIVHHVHSGKIALAQCQEPSSSSAERSTAPPLTNTQLALAFQFFLQHSQSEAEKNGDSATLARFIHFVTGRRYSKLHNSALYKKLLELTDHSLSPRYLQELGELITQLRRFDLEKLAQSVEEALKE